MSPTVLGMASSSPSASAGGGGGGAKATEIVNEERSDERLDLLAVQTGSGDPVSSNLIIPTDTLLKAAISLKDQVIKVTWQQGQQQLQNAVYPTVYTGLLGTAFICLRSYLLTSCHQDLLTCADIVETCTEAARAMRHLTFLCGKGGVYALGSVVFNYLGDQNRRDQYLDLFLEVANEKALPVGSEEGGFGMSYDLLHGRAGFLWAALFIKSHIKSAAKLPDDELLTPVVEAVLSGGRAGSSDNEACPLMYRWHGTRYYGAANGLAGILDVLLHFPLSAEDADDVKQTLRYMMSKRFPGSGNYPSYEGNPRDKLVQWSHGATSMAITLSKASQVFPGERDFRDGAIEAGEVVWKNGLVQKVGLADGTAGNAYAFLALYRLTSEPIYEERAKAFATFLYHNASELMKSQQPHSQVGTDLTDHAYSLFLGLGGVACLWFDLLNPDKSRFPGYEL